MSCTELSQVISCTGGPVTTPNFTREGSDTPMSSSRRRKRSNSGSAGSGGGLVTLNVYATKVCLRFPSSPSPPASLFYTTTTSPSPEQPNNIPREKSNNVSEGVEESCTELIDVSDYKCECDDGFTGNGIHCFDADGNLTVENSQVQPLSCLRRVLRNSS